jgi:hypothetical protein
MPILLFFMALSAIILAFRTVFARPVLLIFAALVFVIFYYIIPMVDPSAARFGNLTPTQIGPEATPTPIPVRRALPVNDDSH